MRRLALAIPLALLIQVACSVAVPREIAPAATATPAATALGLPKPIPQPITRTSPGAQVAWLNARTSPDNRPLLVGIDPSGATVAKLELMLMGVSRAARSADGASLFLFAEDRIDVYSALDGTRVKTYRAAGARVLDTAFSADGRWAAFLLPAARVQLLDLETGLSQTFAVGHDPNAKLPGMSGDTAGVIWATLAFAPDSAHLYAVTDWGGPVRLSAFELSATAWSPTTTAVDGQGAVRYPSCAGPAMRMKVVNAGRTLAAFCNYDASVWLFDLASPTSAAVLHPVMANPFWAAPIFTPDGQLLYVHQWPSFGDQMQVVDLASRRLAGPVPTPTKLGDRGPFSWLAPLVAYAGGTASTVPVSPDGLRLYSATSDGVVVLRIPDLAPIARLASGVATDEVWVSGDGRTVYATAGTHLAIARDDGSPVRTIDVPTTNSFVASERG
jgi:hypothetical protein